MKTNPVDRFVFGTVVIAMTAATGVAAGGEFDLPTGGASARLAPSQPESADPAAAGDADPIAQPEDRWLLSGWAGSVEFGLTGASGNNDRFNLRFAAGATRESESSADQFSLTYSYAKDEATQTENRFEAKGRHDWKLPNESRWRVYMGGIFEYDEFQDWDMRVSIGPGVGYQAIKDEKTNLLLRAGVVVTREIGGSDNAWTPEADLGFDLEHKLTERQTLTASGDFYPALDKFGPYRFAGNVAWTVLVDPEVNLFLKLGVEDRYDSDPGPDRKRNDMTYFATLGWAF